MHYSNQSQGIYCTMNQKVKIYKNSHQIDCKIIKRELPQFSASSVKIIRQDTGRHIYPDT